MIRPMLLFLSLATPAVALDVPTGQDIYVLGEIHDNADHHQRQAELIIEFQPKAVVFEMLSPQQAQTLNTSSRADVAALGDLIGWDSSGWPEFELYRPVFEALGTRRVIGAAAPKKDVRRAFSDGAAAVFGDTASKFDLDIPVPEAQLKIRKEMQFNAHCGAMPLDMMEGMVEAQRYRDAAFADATLNALKEFGAPIMLIAGNGHARIDWGVPYLIALAAPDVATVSIGLMEGADKSADPRFDRTYQFPTQPRSDPCAAFDK